MDFISFFVLLVDAVQGGNIEGERGGGQRLGWKKETDSGLVTRNKDIAG